MNEAFKSGCVRGPYPLQWDGETAYRIGRYLPSLLDVKSIVIGRDARISSPEIFNHLSRGVSESGADVYDIGLVDTPALYFANVKYGFNASVMITASHNPNGDNGLKIHRSNAVPVDSKTGLKELESLIDVKPPAAAGKKGKIEYLDIEKDYLKLLEGFTHGIKKLKVVLDCSDGCAGRFIHKIIRMIPQGEFIILNDKPDGNFPAHGPNPLKDSSQVQIREKIAETKADFGIIFDGDCDRTIFITEKGEMVMPDLILAFLARYYFIHFPEKKNRDDGVIYDLRCSSNVKEYVKKLGGKAHQCKTGHTAIQSAILGNKGLIGAELAGHYYFRDFYGQDSAFIAMLMAFAVVSNSRQKFSEIVEEIEKYAFSGEINFKVKNSSAVLDKLENTYAALGAKIDRSEGIKASFDSWWFLARISNTEPVLRIVVEAEEKVSMRKKVEELTEIITG
ncbi:MAG: phosphomannomutase/phosphoglucomutase [Spirochaetia bacterium]|nr:phosphomannomutase/phosphoglucomutase [Spirochaetia bacterium]